MAPEEEEEARGTNVAAAAVVLVVVRGAAAGASRGVGAEASTGTEKETETETRWTEIDANEHNETGREKHTGRDRIEVTGLRCATIDAHHAGQASHQAVFSSVAIHRARLHGNQPDIFCWHETHDKRLLDSLNYLRLVSQPGPSLGCHKKRALLTAT